MLKRLNLKHVVITSYIARSVLLETNVVIKIVINPDLQFPSGH
jgi:hypothetical protein